MIVITLGDPLSVNISLLTSCLNDLPHQKISVVVMGSWALWNQHPQTKNYLFHSINDSSSISAPGFYFWNTYEPAQLDPRLMTLKERGQVSVSALSALKSMMPVQGRLGILTAPIDKKACHEAGFDFPGHTEFFEDLAQKKGLMLLAGPKLRVALVTQHIPLKKVSEHLTKESIVQKGSTLAYALTRLWNISNPRIAVCGLNPHASDQGLFGREEADIIQPAIEELSKRLPFASFSGPLAADTVFYRAMNGSFDAVLAMYHDQGLGPLKTVHFDDAVNITCGLPFLRVSPDHGPAKDLYETPEKASCASTRAAIQLLKNYVESKTT